MAIIFITGGSGYIGKRLTKQLLQRGHRVIALVRKGSEHKLSTGIETIIADPFDAKTFQQFIPKEAVFVQLLGVSHPSPKKAKQFHEIDLRSVKASADAAANAGVAHFIYLSVAMTPSKLMQAYQAVRSEGEKYCFDKTFSCSFIRPWYVVGPGHWWPIILLPFYGLAEIVPSWRKQARAKALVTIGQMLNALINVIENEPLPLRIIEIKDIRQNAINRVTQLKTILQKPSYL
jgi:nucleoside-diphosphate-sugar epimerase